LFIISSSEDSNEITLARHNLKNLPPNPICNYSTPFFSIETNTPGNWNVEKTMKNGAFFPEQLIRMPNSLAIKDPASASNCYVTQRPDKLYQTSGHYNLLTLKQHSLFFKPRLNRNFL